MRFANVDCLTKNATHGTAISVYTNIIVQAAPAHAAFAGFESADGGAGFFLEN